MAMEQGFNTCNQSTTQNLIHLFQNTVRVGHEEILSWIVIQIILKIKLLKFVVIEELPLKLQEHKYKNI